MWNIFGATCIVIISQASKIVYDFSTLRILLYALFTIKCYSFANHNWFKGLDCLWELWHSVIITGNRVSQLPQTQSELFDYSMI